MKYSKQRELILNYVINSREHPTADMVYKSVKQEIPNISLGTVYRNLNQLSDMNLIRKVTLPNKITRFDQAYSEHCHLYCNNCGLVMDIDKEIMDKTCNMVSNLTDCEIISHDIVFVGICHKCKKEEG